MVQAASDASDRKRRLGILLALALLAIVGLGIALQVTDNFTAPDATLIPVTTAAPANAPSTEPIATADVVNVPDGEELILSSGTVVRLIGIDVPDAGTCGADEAAQALNALVLSGQPIVLISDGRTNLDAEARALRYVDVGGRDVGLELIARGLAKPWSGDGHPRLAAYEAAHSGAPQLCPAG